MKMMLGAAFFGLIEQVTHTTSSNADEHLHKLGTAHGEKGNTCLSCHSSCQEGLSCSWRTHEQHTSRYLSTETLKLVWGFEELNNLLQFILSFIDSSHISKRRARTVFEDQFGATLAKTEDTLLPLRGPSTEKDEQANEEYPGQEIDEQAHPEAVILGRLVDHLGSAADEQIR